MIDTVLDNLIVAAKWKEYRDTHRNLYLVTDGVKAYENSIKIYQQVIKAYMVRNSLEIMPCVMDLVNKETDPKIGVKFLAAGYELNAGNDFTIKSEKVCE